VTPVYGGRETCFQEDSAFANVDESQLERTISSWKLRAQFMCRSWPSKNCQIMRPFDKNVDQKSPTFALPQSDPVIEARKPLLFIDLCWCREGESNPQDPKVGGF
jgi:hypothetical protein